MSPRWERNQRLKCGCMGYWFPHRRGGGACESSPTRDVHLARRYGGEDAVKDIIVEHALTNPGPAVPAECPF